MQLILARLFSLVKKIEDLEKGQRKIMAAIDDVKAALSQLDSVTSELADDIKDLVSKLADGGLSKDEVAQVVSEIQSKVDALKGVAAIHTPGVPEPPVIEG